MMRLESSKYVLRTRPDHDEPTPAGKLQIIQELYAPPDENGEPQPGHGLITLEDARRLLEMVK